MLSSYHWCYRCMNKLRNNSKRCPVCGNIISKEKILNFSLNPGTLLHNRYTVGNVICKTNNTLTYIAIDEQLGSKIAILELFPTEIVKRIDSKAAVKNFNNEKLFEKLKTDFSNLHKSLISLRVLPNILKMFTIFQQNNTIYVVQENPQGISFEKYLSNNYGELSWPNCEKMFLKLIKLMKYLHSNNIVHCNLYPKTLFVEDGILKIIDFSNSLISNSLINSANILTSPKLNDGYSAPEQYDNKKVGTYTDVYSVAAIMYKALTGTKPVNSKSRLANDNLLPPKVLNSNIPKNVSFAIMSALVLSPKLRTQTMKDFYEDLTAPAREDRKRINIQIETPIEQIIPIKKPQPKQTSNHKKPKKTKSRSIVFLSFLISCSIVSFFLVVVIFLLFSDSLFG